MKRSVILSVCSLLVVLGLLTANASMASQRALSYRIGFLADRTGVYAGMDKNVANGKRAAIKEINQKGGVNGHLLEVIEYDVKSEEAAAVMAAKKLCELDKVHIIFDQPSTGLALATAPIINEAGIPHVVHTGSEVFDKPVKKWSFRLNCRISDAINSVFQFFKDEGIANVAVLAHSAGMGQSFWKLTHR